jgi:hypothetical protein
MEVLADLLGRAWLQNVLGKHVVVGENIRRKKPTRVRLIAIVLWLGET